jgi:signal transduction histidine kinase/DNA-binding NarL/FixJ family response regulator
MKPKSILIVEDEAIVSLDLSLLLEDAGYIINRICNSSDQLFKDFDSFPRPDLILMDVHIKGSLDGTEASLKIKKMYDIPVIFITAYADKNTLERAKSSFPYGYIIKPYDKRKLLVIIEMGLNIIDLEKEVKRREELFSATFNSISDAVIITDNNNLIKYLNPVAEAMIISENPIGCEFSAIFDIQIENDGKRGLFKDKFGKQKTLEIKKNRLESPSYDTNGFVWILTDITISVFLELQLRESQKMEAVGRLAGGIAHDFNNLLTVIMGYCSLILDNRELMDQNNSLKSDISGIQLTSQKAVKLTKQLLTFTNNQVHNPRKVNLNSIIIDLDKIFERLIPSHIRFEKDLTGVNTFINIDPVQMEQILINLVVNSRDAIMEEGIIRIKTSIVKSTEEKVFFLNMPQGEYVQLSLIDNGSGIPEALHSKIFEPFFSTKETGKGLGLGLSTVYGIVQQAGGFIDLQSSPDNGTIFNLFFPHVINDLVSRKTSTKPRNNDMGKESILIVEEDEFVRSIMHRILSSKGYTVKEARNAGEALLMCEMETKTCDLIITDMFMPLISGMELVQRIRTYFPLIKSLYTSTHNYESIEDENIL